MAVLMDITFFIGIVYELVSEAMCLYMIKKKSLDHVRKPCLKTKQRKIPHFIGLEVGASVGIFASYITDH